MTKRHKILGITIWIFAVLGVAAVATSGILLLSPQARRFALAEISGSTGQATSTMASNNEPEEERHALALGEQALRNIGIDPASGTIQLALTDYSKSVEFPSTVIERPGRTSIIVSSPISGVVKRIYREPGVSTQTGKPLFDIELKHEDLIRWQAEMLSSLKKRDIIDKELFRLESLPPSLVQKTKRDLEFKRAEIESSLAAKRQILQLHGVPLEQITATLEEGRRMIEEITVLTPIVCDHETDETDDTHCDEEHDPYILFQILVEKGQQVTMGDSLCRIGDLAELYIEGEAFARDELKLLTAVKDDLPVRATFDVYDDRTETIDGLKIRYIDSQISPENRTTRFFVDLPNRVVSTKKTDDDTEFVTWRFKPGQRCRIEIPYETFSKCFVVPLTAIATEGPETFVFQQSGNDAGRRRWVKIPVHVMHRGRNEAAIAVDGSLFPGDVIAARGAGQLLLALTGGGGKLQSACPCDQH